MIFRSVTLSAAVQALQAATQAALVLAKSSDCVSCLREAACMTH